MQPSSSLILLSLILFIEQIQCLYDRHDQSNREIVQAQSDKDEDRLLVENKKLQLVGQRLPVTQMITYGIDWRENNGKGKGGSKKSKAPKSSKLFKQSKKGGSCGKGKTGKAHKKGKKGKGYDITPYPSISTTPSCSPAPSIMFDLMNCDSYSINWARDLRESCAIDECKCSDAEFRLSIGEIECNENPLVDQCPVDCDVCKECLGVYLVDYCESIPSASPSSSTSPTDDNFDLDICDTYKTQWTEELSTSCQDGLCACSDATERLINNEIQCDMEPLTDKCPLECDICVTCLSLISFYCDYVTASPTEITKSPISAPPTSSIVITESPNITSVSPSYSPLPTSKQSILPTQDFNLSPTVTPTTLTMISQLPSIHPSVPSTDSPSFDSTIIHLPSISPSDAITKPSTSALPTSSTVITESPNITSASPSYSPLPTSTQSILPTQNFNLSPTVTPTTLTMISQLPSIHPSVPLSVSPSFDPTIIHLPSISPSDSISVHPTVSLPQLPSQSPTLASPHSIVPTKPFDLADCDTYSGDWLFDLAETCTGIPASGDSKGCVCRDAEKKINNGFITCGVDRCDAVCKVCVYCLYDLLNCIPQESE